MGEGPLLKDTGGGINQALKCKIVFISARTVALFQDEIKELLSTANADHFESLMYLPIKLYIFSVKALVPKHQKQYDRF